MCICAICRSPWHQCTGTCKVSSMGREVWGAYCLARILQTSWGLSLGSFVEFMSWLVINGWLLITKNQWLCTLAYFPCHKMPPDNSVTSVPSVFWVEWDSSGPSGQHPKRFRKLGTDFAFSFLYGRNCRLTGWGAGLTSVGTKLCYFGVGVMQEKVKLLFSLPAMSSFSGILYYWATGTY